MLILNRSLCLAFGKRLVDLYNQLVLFENSNCTRLDCTGVGKFHISVKNTGKDPCGGRLDQAPLPVKTELLKIIMYKGFSTGNLTSSWDNCMPIYALHACPNHPYFFKTFIIVT